MQWISILLSLCLITTMAWRINKNTKLIENNQLTIKSNQEIIKSNQEISKHNQELIRQLIVNGSATDTYNKDLLEKIFKITSATTRCSK